MTPTPDSRINIKLGMTTMVLPRGGMNAMVTEDYSSVDLFLLDDGLECVFSMEIPWESALSIARTVECARQSKDHDERERNFLAAYPDGRERASIVDPRI